MADHEREQEHWQELRETDEAERERAVRQRIDVPAHRDREHLERQRRKDPCAPEALKRRLLRPADTREIGGVVAIVGIGGNGRHRGRLV
jgi:hypothetical protein